LSRRLESITKLPIDIKVLDYAPPWFRVRALSGVVLIEKKPALATRLRFKALQEINDIKMKVKKALS